MEQVAQPVGLCRGQVGHGVLLAIERHQSDGHYSAAEDGVCGALTNNQKTIKKQLRYLDNFYFFMNITLMILNHIPFNSINESLPQRGMTPKKTILRRIIVLNNPKPHNLVRHKQLLYDNFATDINNFSINHCSIFFIRAYVVSNTHIQSELRTILISRLIADLAFFIAKITISSDRDFCLY